MKRSNVLDRSRPWRRILRGAAPLSLGLLVMPGLAAAQVAPDATATGPSSVATAEYKLAASIDPDVLSGRTTELWARVYRPTTWAATPAPLVVFLHGNHATCGRGSNPRIDDRTDYTSSGTCPAGYVVTPNHAGYAYLAEKLASWGYVVVSINANRGINAAGGVSGDSGLNLARGRLILKHLQRLSEWNKDGGTPSSLGVELKGHLDFGNVALLGHSRGGEGVRAAYNLYRDTGSAWPAKIQSPITWKALFEIGPVDGQTSRVLNADGVSWAVLLPMCDGDVSNLQGIKPYDRMMRMAAESPARQKAVVAVWGANHNFYNTEWQTSDSRGCTDHTALFPQTIGSTKQQDTAVHTALALLRGNVGAADASFNKIFPSRYALPTALAAITPVDRSFSDSAASAVSITLDDFDKATGTSTAGAANESAGVTVSHGLAGNRHESGQRAASIAWSAASANTYFQSNFTAAGTGRDVSPYKYLNLRVARQDSSSNPRTPLATGFKILLVDSDGNRSTAVPIGAHVKLTGPVGGPSGKHVLLQSAQIPISSFGTFPLTRVRGVRLQFDDTASGAIFVSNLRFSNSQVEALRGADPAPEEASIAAALRDETMERVTVASVRARQHGPIEVRDVAYLSGVQRVSAPGGERSSLAAVDGYELVIRTRETFPVRDELPILRVGERVFDLSRYPDSGETDALLFRVSQSDFAALPDGADVSLSYGEAGPGQASTIYTLGRLNKAVIR